MNEDIEMEGFDQIYEFMEGMLAHTAETEMFYKLASNEDLRTEFRQLVRFDKSLHNNRNLLEIPHESHVNLFNSLGVPLTESSDEDENKRKFFWGNFNLKKMLPFMITGLLSSLATFLIFFSLMGKPEYESKNVVLAQNYKKEINFLKNELVKQNNKSHQDVKIVRDTLVKNQIVYKETQVNPIGNSLQNSYPSVKTVKNLESGSHSQLNQSPDSKLDRISFSNPILMLSPPNQPAYGILINSSNDDKDYEIILGGTQYWSIPNPTISPKKLGDFINMQLAFRYRISPQLKVSADVRRETFYQKFSGYDALDQYTIYEQQPNFTTFDLGVLYYPVDLGDFNPYAAFSFGGNHVGIVWRGGIGINYLLADRVSFELGFDYSALYYSFGGNWFNSPKIGINYGISYNIR